MTVHPKTHLPVMPIHSSGKNFQSICFRIVERICTQSPVRVGLNLSAADAGSIKILYQNDADRSCVMASVYIDREGKRPASVILKCERSNV